MFAGFFASLRQRDFRVRHHWETRLKFRFERMVWQKDSRGVSSRPMPFSEHGSRRKRVWRQMRSPQGADSDVSGSRYDRLWEQMRTCMGRCSLTNTESVLSVSLMCWKLPFPWIYRIANLFFSSTNIKGQFHFHKASPTGHDSEFAVFLGWLNEKKAACPGVDRQPFRVYIAMRLSDGD